MKFNSNRKKAKFNIMLQRLKIKLVKYSFRFKTGIRNEDNPYYIMWRKKLDHKYL